MLQGPYSSLDRDRDRPLLRLPFTSFAVVTVLLPLTGLIACLSISLMYHFTDATYTHCQLQADPSRGGGVVLTATGRKDLRWRSVEHLILISLWLKVSNYLPSISSAISRVPERYIWRCCIGLHSAPRYLVAVAYFNFYRSRFARRLLELLLSGLALLCSLTENTGLLLLTYVASTETYNVHKDGFIVFIASSLLHMLITCRLWHVIRRSYVNPEEVTSCRWKMRLFIFNCVCCVVAYYFFRRHNKYCEPGIYTLFALCEYLVVVSNMAFHMTAFWDFGSKEVMVATLPEDKRY